MCSIKSIESIKSFAYSLELEFLVNELFSINKWTFNSNKIAIQAYKWRGVGKIRGNKMRKRMKPQIVTIKMCDWDSIVTIKLINQMLILYFFSHKIDK